MAQQLRLRLMEKHIHSMRELDKTYEAYITQLLKQKREIGVSMTRHYYACMEEINAIGEQCINAYDHVMLNDIPLHIDVADVPDHFADASVPDYSIFELETHQQSHDDDDENADDENADDVTSNGANHDSKQFACDYCDFTSAWKHSVRRHERVVHGGDDEDGDDENGPNAEHAKEEPSIARQQRSHAKSELESITVGQGRTVYACRYCEYQTPVSQAMKRHEMRHRGEKPYKCRFCDYSEVVQCTVTLHERRMHTHEKPFKCEQCNKGFVTRCELKRHEKKSCLDNVQHRTTVDVVNESKASIQGNKKFKCRFCDYRSPRNTNMILHERRVHTKEKPFVCKTCRKSFYRNSELTKHQTNDQKCRRKSQK